MVYHLGMQSGDTSQVRVREVAGKAMLDEFIRVPWGIYANDPNWVPPLMLERRKALSWKHPYFKHADWAAWIAYRGDKAVGRISAQMDRLYLQSHDEATGFFGLIEAQDDRDIFRALFDAAHEWLRKRGMKRVLGPFNLGINQEMGLLVEGLQTPPYVMMGHAQAYYEKAIELLGYLPEQDTFAYELEISDFRVPPVMHRLLKRQASKISTRVLDKNRSDHDLEVMRSIFNDAWSNNWGFVPFTEQEFKAVGKELLLLIPDDFVCIAEVDGIPAAFITMVPNLNEAIKDLDGKLFPLGWLKLAWRLKVKTPKSARVVLMGVRKEYQFTRLGPALALLVIDQLRKPANHKGVERVEMSWILEDNHGMRNIIEKMGGKISKRYRMYRKELN
jgi:GNAT superfamily N-acetyltransferase